MGRAGTRVPGADEGDLASILRAASYTGLYFGLSEDGALWTAYARQGEQGREFAYLSERGDLVLARDHSAREPRRRTYHMDRLAELVSAYAGIMGECEPRGPLDRLSRWALRHIPLAGPIAAYRRGRELATFCAREQACYGQDALVAIAPQVRQGHHLPDASLRLLDAARASPPYAGFPGAQRLSPHGA